MALSTGQVEDVLRKAGIDLGRTQQFTGRQDLTGTAGQDILLRELTGQTGGFQQREEQQNLGTAREGFFQKQAGEEEAFLGRFRTEYPQIISGVEEQLGLPGLRKAAFGATENLSNLPEAVQQATFGRDVSAGQLGRITSSRQQEQLPEVNELLRSLQFGEEEFGRRSERELVPFKTEASFLTDRLAREATGFGIEQQGRLEVLLKQLENEGNLAVEEKKEAIELAKLEQAKEDTERSISTVDLGNRVALLDAKGNEIGSLAKGKLSGTLDEGW